jgi:hypothetical protein
MGRASSERALAVEGAEIRLTRRFRFQAKRQRFPVAPVQWMS